MSEFKVHTVDTAPEQSVAFLQGAQQAFGFVPNLIGVLWRRLDSAERHPSRRSLGAVARLAAR